MKRTFLFLLPAAFLFSCNSNASRSGGQTDSRMDTTLVATDKVPVTAPQSPAVWQSLFNGKDLSGWRGYQHKPTDAWEVVDGVLHCNGHKKDAAHTDLITDQQYQNFVLQLQWKISPASNSGIMFHVTEDQPYTSSSGPEFQIIDDEGWPGKLEAWQHTGCNYAMQLPDSIHVNPVGQWNSTKIVVQGPHVEHWLNGEKILSYELWSPEWKRQKAAGKWKDVPSYGMAKTGHIALQYHGGDVWFKDIQLKAF